MTNDEITKLVKGELGLQDSTAYDESSFVNSWVYAGTLDLLARTRCIVRCVHLNTFANKGQYTLDHKILTLVDVENGHRRRMRRDQRHSYDEQRYVVVGKDPSYYLSDRGFTLVRSDVLVIKPTPSEDGYLDVWAVLRPTRMTAPTDDLGTEAFGAIPDEYQDAVILYALWKGSSFADDQSGQQGERYRVQYEGADGRGGRLAQIRAMVNRRGTASLASARVSLSASVPSGYFT